MDISFTAKPQTLTLISSTPLIFLSSTKLGTIRRQFLGSSHNLRPPGSLRARRKCEALGRIHIQFPRFLFKASMDSHAVLVVVAMAVLSAISVYFNHYQKRKKNEKGVSGSPSLALSQLGKGIMNRGSESQNLISRDHDKHIFETESKVLGDKTSKNRYISEYNEGTMQFEDASVHGGILVTKTLESPGSDVPALSASVSISSNDSEVTDQSLSLAVSESGALQPFTFSTEMMEFQLQGCQEETKFDYKFSTVNELAKVDEHNEANHELDEKSDIANYGSSYEESVREELHTFYEEKKPLTNPLENLNGLESVSSYASQMNPSKLSTPLRNSLLQGSELPAQGFLHTAEYSNGKLPLVYYKEASTRKEKRIEKVRSVVNADGRRYMPQNKYKTLPKVPNGIHVHEKLHRSEPISAYNHLLKSCRLTECVELLEEIQRMDLLDMTKIYHARFFEICKSQKAVKEAFRFTKLISNPTLSTYNMLMSVCASSQDSGGAFQVRKLVQEAGLKFDCKLYTTLISTCAKSGKVDAMFEVFHEMVNSGVEPNVNTYGALIDGCARARQVAKAFGAYGILRSKKVKPDRIIFNALITSCGQSGAVDRAFDVLAEMRAEMQPIDPDHITVGALIKACTNAGQIARAKEVYKMIHEYNIKGTPEVYTIAVSSCSHTGDWEFAHSVYVDMTKNGVVPDEMFVSALIDVAGHAGKVDAAFEILQEARNQGIRLGIVSYSSLMGACCNAKNWQKALDLYENIKSIKLKPTISTTNALITALCDGDQLHKALEVLSEINRLGLCPNAITYSVLLVACEKKDDPEVGIMLFSQAKRDGVSPNLVMHKCIIGMCLRRFEKASALGEPVLSFSSGRPQIETKWTSEALVAYRETVASGTIPTKEVVSQILGCLKFPSDASSKNKLIENLEVSAEISTFSYLCSLLDGFGEYDPRAFSILEEATSFGIIPCVSFKASPIVVDVRALQQHTAEVYLLTVLKGLKYRLAAGAKLPNITILLPIEKTSIASPKGEKTINLAGRTAQLVGALLRRFGLRYQGNESFGKIRINGLALRRWFQPKLTSSFGGEPGKLSSSQTRLGKGITYQQRLIRTGNYSME